MDAPEQFPKVLIVDDNKENIDLIAYFLKPQNYQILTALDGFEALEIVERDEPDIILLDIMLPKMDGFQVCERIKKGRKTQFIPIIMITALKELKDKIRSLEVGADDFISKPFENVELLTRVKSLLRIKKYHDEIQQKNLELEEKNKALLRLDKFKEELNHLIVHDMKNPLFVIQGNLQMMSMAVEKTSSPTLKKYLDRIDRSTQNLLRMVLNLIDIAKIEDGKMELNHELVNINDLVNKCIHRFEDYPENQNKTFDLNLTEGGSTLKVDSSVIERVFDNLISFAVANVPENGKIEIGSKKVNNTLEYFIHDHGQQIPMKYSNDLFNKFSQAEIKKDGFRLGRGLGLTFCKLAVEAHGGSLCVDPDNKIGNRFLLNLPTN
ncbi:MAG: response regulator [Calditrichaceae bacterium]|jgi:K+-sensing histidine kinase KdpD